MCRKSFIICLSVLFVTTLINIPAKGDVTATGNPMTVGWPTLNEAPPKAQTCNDPNELPTNYQDPGTQYRCTAGFANGRIVSQTFSTDANTDGFTLTRIAIRATGSGSSNPDINGPFTVHIIDINATYGQILPVLNYYIPANGIPYCGSYDLLSGPAFAADPCLLAYASADTDTLIYFDFNEFDKVDLEPNHTYAFEIWGPYGWTQEPPYVFLWIWYCQSNPYAAGAAYETYGPCEIGPCPLDLTEPRFLLGGVDHDTVTAIYGDYVDGNAYHPSPRKYQTHVSVNPTLTWHPGKWAKNHQVWFSTSFNAVSRRLSSANKGRVTNPYYTPTANLATNTTYYWRIDEYNDTNTVPVPHHPDGNNYWGVDSSPSDRPTIWRFTTISPYATNPVPATAVVPKEAMFKLTDACLKWTAGDLVQTTNGHRIFFDTNALNVANATTSTPVIYRGTVTDPCYPLKNLYPDYALTSGTTYYWRVDEVNGTNVWPGPVWNFKMPNPAFIFIDDFNYLTPAAFASVWQSGYQNNGGSISKTGTVMTLNYDNSGSTFDNWSEAKLDFNSPSGVDLTLGGVFVPKALAVRFDGQVDLNNLDPTYNKLYMGLEDTSGNNGFVSLDSDPYAAQRAINAESSNDAANREFKVALTDPNFSTVDLTEVNRVYLGIGLRGLTGETLTLYKGALKFTNLKVYVQHCNPTYPSKSMVAGDLAGPLQGPIDGYHSRYTVPDCAVNIYDMFYMLGYDWLFNEPNLVYDSNVDPGTSNLTVWYKFDEGSGIVLADSSGNGRDATLYNVGPFAWAYAGHNGSGSCVNLEPGQHTWIECPNTVVANFGGQTGQSFTFWLNHTDKLLEGHLWPSVLVFHSNAPGAGTDAQTMETQLPNPFQNGGAFPWLRWVDTRISKECGLQRVRGSMVSNRWNHYALIYDTAATKMSMYVNGVLIASTVDSAITRVWGPGAIGDGNANTVRIGQRGNSGYAATDGWGFWQGRIDDMRLYSKALSENEVRYLVTDGTGQRNMQASFNEPDNFSSSVVTLPAGPAVQIVNFNDFAILANYWLNQQLWP